MNEIQRRWTRKCNCDKFLRTL